MPYITEIDADGDLNTAVANFNTVCIANAATLSLTPANLTEIAAAATSFEGSLNSAIASKATSKGLVEAKDLQKKATKAVISKYAKIFRANLAVPDNLLDQLMVPHHKTPGTKTPPTEPLDLTASADGNGLVLLKWNRNGNRAGTQYFIEVRTDPQAEWTISGGTTKVQFSYQAAPGVYIAFRIVAARNGMTSPASVPVSLWENGGQVELQLAA